MDRVASGLPPTPFEVAQYLSENGDLLEAAHERLSLGRLHESLQYSLILHQNLVHLATHADEDPALVPLSFSRTPPAQSAADADAVVDDEDADAAASEQRPAAAAAGGSGVAAAASTSNSDTLQAMLDARKQRAAPPR